MFTSQWKKVEMLPRAPSRQGRPLVQQLSPPLHLLLPPPPPPPLGLHWNKKTFKTHWTHNLIWQKKTCNSSHQSYQSLFPDNCCPFYFLHTSGCQSTGYLGHSHPHLGKKAPKKLICPPAWGMFHWLPGVNKKQFDLYSPIHIGPGVNNITHVKSSCQECLKSPSKQRFHLVQQLSPPLQSRSVAIPSPEWNTSTSTCIFGIEIFRFGKFWTYVQLTPLHFAHKRSNRFQVLGNSPGHKPQPRTPNATLESCEELVKGQMHVFIWRRRKIHFYFHFNT